MVVTGTNHTCTIDQNNDLNCFGKNSDILYKLLNDNKYVTVGNHTTCVIKIDDSADCFGDNRYGMIDIPDQVKRNVLSVSSGLTMTCVISDKLYCFGVLIGGIME